MIFDFFKRNKNLEYKNFRLNFFARRNSEQLLTNSAISSDRLTYEDLNDFDIQMSHNYSTSPRSISPRKELVSYKKKFTEQFFVIMIIVIVKNANLATPIDK